MIKEHFAIYYQSWINSGFSWEKIDPSPNYFVNKCPPET